MDIDSANTPVKKEFFQKLQELNRVANTLPDMIAVFDLSNHNMVYTNRASFAAEGYDHKKLQEMDPESRAKTFIHPNDLAGYSTYFATLKTAGEDDTVTLEYRAKNEHGEWQWFLSRGKVFHCGNDGLPTHCINIVQNISQRKITEQSVIEKNIELQEKNDELAAFAFIASHDLREPLRKINTFSSWLIEKESSQLSEQGKIYLKRMQNSVSRMDLLISDILTLLSLQDKEQDHENVDLEQVLKRTLEELDAQVNEAGAVISYNELPVIKGYTSAVHYVFLNLLANGIKFRKKDTTPAIHISAKKITGLETGFYNADLKKHYYEICFADNGIGFEGQYSKIIFQMFQRLHGKSEYPGTGIGLAICKKVMDNHEGFIRAEATPGSGSRFYCYFPII